MKRNKVAPCKRGRGRPRKHGVKDGSELFRASFLVAVYNVGRLEGMTDRSAKQHAISIFTREFPDARVSASTVDRALKLLQPSGHEEVFLLAAENLQPIRVALGFGTRPKYGRAEGWKSAPLNFSRKFRGK